ncbi:unnamed protein product [Closterium sp. NIES-64]|nr:unnamed protein product [Closterium sp. NIES-64]CAI5994648.1 unnamed protein product [Closterium sp. NIES-65]
MAQLLDVPDEERLDPGNPDEIGIFLGDNRGQAWDGVAKNESHLHGPKLTLWRLCRFMEYLFNETEDQAKKMREGRQMHAGKVPKACTPSMLKAKMNAMSCLGEIEGRLFSYSPSRVTDMTREARGLLRIKLANLSNKQIDEGFEQTRGSLNDVYTAAQYRDLFHKVLPEWRTTYFRASVHFLSEGLWRVLAVSVMIMLAHQMLGRGCSIRSLRFANMYVYETRSTSLHDEFLDLPVMVFVSRQTKNNPTNRLSHQYVARHIDYRRCGYGGVFLWIHFLYDLVEGLSDDRCPDALIAKLGGWEQGEMRRSYLLGVPFEPVLLMAGFSGDPGDYYIGRAHARLADDTEWEELQELFRKHIYPWLEEEMTKDAIYRLQGTQKMTKLQLQNQELMENAGRLTAENGQLRMENKSLHEELELVKAALAALQRGDDAPPCVASNGGSADPKTEVCDEKPVVETKQREAQRLYFAAVLAPWLTCSTLSDAWKLWDRGTGRMDGRTIRDLAKSGDFLATYSEYGNQTLPKNTRSKQLGRRRNQMLTIDSLRPDDSEAATAYALELGDWLLGQSSESS